jgi:nucleotide-binding universal stress UspA family protein
MYNKVLVPMDGSQFGQCALDHVRAIGLGCKVPEIVLLRVVEPISSNEMAALAQAKGNAVAQAEKAHKADAEDYISTMAKRLSEEGMAVKGEVVNGKADEKIIDYAEKNHFDLIIMASHGRSGITRWAMGSVADRVMRNSRVPVLLVPTPGCRVAQGGA